MENNNDNVDVKRVEAKKYPISEEEYIHAVQENFKRIYPTLDIYFDMLYDERVIKVIKRGYKRDCWSYDNGQTTEGYFDINNPVLGNSILPSLELAVEFSGYIDKNPLEW